MYDLLIQFIKKRGAIDEASLHKICSCFKLITAKRKQILLDYNQVSKEYFFINKGSIRIFTVAKDGSENSRYFAFAGNLVTALPSFIDQKPALEYVQCLENSELLSIRREDFYSIVQEVPLFSKIYTEKLELGFIAAQKRIYGFQGFDALEKVQWIIQNQPQLLQQVSNKMVASYLGISPSTLSRIKSKL